MATGEQQVSRSFLQRCTCRQHVINLVGPVCLYRRQTTRATYLFFRDADSSILSLAAVQIYRTFGWSKVTHTTAWAQRTASCLHKISEGASCASDMRHQRCRGWCRRSRAWHCELSVLSACLHKQRRRCLQNQVKAAVYSWCGGSEPQLAVVADSFSHDVVLLCDRPQPSQGPQ